MMNIENFKPWLRKNSPVILTTVSCLAAVGSVVFTFFASRKVDKVLEPANTKLTNIKVKLKNKTITEKQAKKEKIGVLTKTGFKLVGLFTPTLLCLGINIGSNIGSYKIMSARNAGLIAANAALTSAFTQFKERASEKFGKKEVDDLINGREEVEEEYVDENGQKHKKMVAKQTRPAIGAITIPFNSLNPNWSDCGPVNYEWIKQTVTYLNRKLYSRGYLFDEEILHDFGVELSGLTRAQRSWIKTHGLVYDAADNNLINDVGVALGLTTETGEDKADMINLSNGWSTDITLNLSDDGYILDKFTSYEN